MNKYIASLEEVKTWNTMVRNHISERVNILPSTWYFKIKRYSYGRFCKFKAVFFVRGYLQQEEVHYTVPYSPVVGWSKVRAVLLLLMK